MTSDNTPEEPNIIDMLKDALAAQNVALICALLKGISRSPTGNERMLALLEQLLEDRRIALCAIPPHYGEIKWFAGYALAAEYFIQGIDKKVFVMQTFRPIPDNVIRANQNRVNMKQRPRDMKQELWHSQLLHLLVQGGHVRLIDREYILQTFKHI